MEQISSGDLSFSRSANEDESTVLTLEDLKNIFKKSIEAEVVEMIWQDSNGNSEVALSYLTEMCPATPLELPTSVQTTASVSNNTWSSIVLTKPPKDPPMAPSVRPKFKPTQHKPTNANKCGIVDIIKNRVKKRERILVIMRGVPGSGKSTLARKMQGNGVVLSTDDFFVNKYGEYYFDPRSLPDAHSWNQRRADREMKASTNPIIIDNTNLEAWEMQPYVCMALRYKYSVELVEPDTPWKRDARTLSQKNTHGVHRAKIEQMLEKQSVPIDLAAVIETCRQKLNIPAMTFQESSAHQTQTSSDLTHCQETISLSILAKTSSAPNLAPPSSSVSSLTSEENSTIASPVLQTADFDGYEINVQEGSAFKDAEKTVIPALESATIIQALRREKSSDEKLVIESEGEDTISEPIHSKKKALALLKSYFPALDTKDLADILEQCKDDVTWAINVLLDSGYECADVVLDTSDLLEEEYKTEDIEEKTIEDAGGLNPVETTTEPSTEEVERTGSPIAEASGSQAENTEALRRHIEECFQLTDTISEHARRVCGKDYNQFRAFQLQKLRHGQPSSEFDQLDAISGLEPFETATPFEAASSSIQEQSGYTQYDVGGTAYFSDFRSHEEYQMPQLPSGQLVEEEAMVPITVDPSFIQQLVSFFGPPESPTKNPESDAQKNPITFDIPWSLAEQLYFSWCSSNVEDTSEEAQDEEPCAEKNDGGELKSIMDIEYAMKMIEEEKNAELKQLRESLSTKISRKMLQENFPQVDPLALEALFEANSYNYGQTVAALNASLGTAPKVAEPEEIKSPSKPKPSPKTEEADKSQGYNDIRSEAFMYHRLREQYSAKARENHQRGMTAVAAYYASESRRYAALYKECNQKAALQIVEKKNARQDERTIDLHELHVVEALSCLESFIVSNLKEGRTVVHVITGRGNNSVNGRARIKPAVITFLKQKRYAFEVLNPGMLRVFIQRN